jgi:hypothetical protein
MITGMGRMFRELCRWELGSTSGMVTDASEIFRLDNLESEVLLGACGGLSYPTHSYSKVKKSAYKRELCTA